jgi:hypothetical protein
MSKTHLGELDQFLNRLEPVRRGYATVLAMTDPRYMNNPRYRGKRANQLIAIAPGELYGLRRKSVLVSVVGNGSALIYPVDRVGLDGLVLAGIPSRLAGHLMEALHLLLKEQ